ncbi:hypothetical protein MRX96_054468 [Rhipicephalus microplus]
MRPTQQPQATTLSNHHKPPSITAPAVTTWMTTRPNVLFTPTKLALRPSPFVPTTIQVKKTTAVNTQSDAASTPMLEDTYTTSQTPSQPMPTKKYVTVSGNTFTNRDRAEVRFPYHNVVAGNAGGNSCSYHGILHVPDCFDAQVRVSYCDHAAFHYTAKGEYTSYAVSRLPPSTLNDLSDLDAGVKTQGYPTTLGMLMPTESGNVHTTPHPGFVDLTETTTTQPPPDERDGIHA